MPFTKDPGIRENAAYCSYCYKNGGLCYKGTDLKEFQKLAYEGMISHGTPKLLAKFYTWTIKFAPRWKNKAPQNQTQPSQTHTPENG